MLVEELECVQRELDAVLGPQGKAMKDDSAKFKDFEVVVKSKQNNEPLPEPDDQVSVINLQLLPQYETVGKGAGVQLEPLLHEPDEKEHSGNDLIALL